MTDALRQADSKRHTMWCLALGGIAASVLMFWITLQGPGVNPDSTVYLETARNLAAGVGFVAAGETVTHYPPAYPLLLALASLNDSNFLGRARFVHVVLFGVVALLFGLTVYVATERSRLATLAGFLLFLSSRSLLTIHSYAWSEPLFLACTLGGLLLLASHIATPRRTLLVGGSLLVGSAAITRYVGVVLLAPTVVGLYLAPGRSRRERLHDILIALLCAGTPLALWLIRNVIAGETATNRPLAVHPVSLFQLKLMVVSLYNSVLQLDLSAGLKAVTVAIASAAFAAGCWWFVRTRDARPDASAVATAWTLLGSAAALAYLAFVVLSISFFDAATSLDTRLLAPAVLLLLPAMLSVARHAAITRARPAIWRGLLAIVVVVSALNLPGTVEWIAETRANGQEYTSTAWRNSPVLKLVRALPSRLLVYSNDAPAVRFVAERAALMIPLEHVPSTKRSNPRYEAELRAVCRACEADNAVLVWFDSADIWFRETRQRFEAECASLERQRVPGATVYRARQDGAAVASPGR